MSSLLEETIVAVATPVGRGAISIIRLSGPDVRQRVLRHLSDDTSLVPRRATLGWFRDQQERILDRVMLTFYPSPASYTGEDLMEISCHGSPPVTRQIVDLLVSEGARLARPGEFTLRAFLNGKMDLAQAESVRDLIESQTAFQARVAAQQLEGRLSAALEPGKAELIRIISHMETALEFVEDDVQPEARDRLIQSLAALDAEMARLEDSFRLGKLVHEGVSVAIVGKPNAGKSSLFNALLRENRAIVTEIPGTTRDAVTETVSLQGVPTRLADTAGIREARDPVEEMGVKKSLEYVRESDLILFVIDGSTTFGEEDAGIWELIRALPYVLVLNKADLTLRAEPPGPVGEQSRGQVTVSALLGRGLDELSEAILRAVSEEETWETERVLITSLRHKHCLERAREHLKQGVQAYRNGLSEEFPLYNLRKVLQALGEITGETTVEDILEQIFSTFCIGK